MEYDIVYKTDKQSFRFALNQGVLISTLDGFTGLPVNIDIASSIYQYGGTISSQTIDARTLVIGGIIYKDVENVKNNLINTFLPFEEGTLTVNGKHEIKCYMKNTPEVSKTKKYADFMITLYCPFPLFRDVDQTFIDLRGFSSEFKFPWNLTKTYRFATVISKDEFAVSNLGHYSSGYELRLIANGTVVNPKIVLQNSLKKDLKSLRLITTMKDGDVIIVKSDEQGITAHDDDGNDVTGVIAFDSDFFSIPVGDNVILTTADDTASAENIDGTISFYKFRSGVVV